MGWDGPPGGPLETLCPPVVRARGGANGPSAGQEAAECLGSQKARSSSDSRVPGQQPSGPQGLGLRVRVTDTAGGEGPTLPSAPASALAAESPPSPLCWPPTLSSFSHSAPSPGPGHGTAGRKETHPFTKRSCGPSDNLTLKGSWDHTHRAASPQPAHPPQKETRVTAARLAWLVVEG